MLPQESSLRLTCAAVGNDTDVTATPPLGATRIAMVNVVESDAIAASVEHVEFTTQV